jgi:hypothetical protein
MTSKQHKHLGIERHTRELFLIEHYPTEISSTPKETLPKRIKATVFALSERKVYAARRL